MPIYVYKCENCKHEFEEWQKVNDEPLTICPNCNGKLHRVFFPTPVIFKGPGFYITDSREEKKRQEKKMEKDKDALKDKSETLNEYE